MLNSVNNSKLVKNFSVLMAVYKKDSSVFLDEAIDSIWTSQTLKPTQIVLVVDGPIPKSIKTVITKWEVLLGEVMTIVWLPENIGLGGALSIGMAHCRFDLIARMDSDDISIADRFTHQLTAFENNPDLALVGGQVLEFENDIIDGTHTRAVPIEFDEITSFAKLRSPVNHPSVMFKKKALESVGGYRVSDRPEDYYLWIRLLLAGHIITNLPSILVFMRVNSAFFSRRRGWCYFLSEIKFQKFMLASGFIGIGVFIRNILFRGFVRLLPGSLLTRIYRLTRRHF